MSEHVLEVVDDLQEDRGARYHPSLSIHAVRPHGEIYLCGTCGIIVARDVAPEDVRTSVIRCANCGAGNRLPRAAEDIIGGKTGGPLPLRGDR